MPPRRAKRTKAESDSGDDAADSDYAEAPPPTKRARGGKGAKRTTAAAPRKKTAKGKGKEPVKKGPPKTGLHVLPEMPLDIIYEILSYLEPVDLVHLMKVNNAFNNFLASDGAKPFWDAADRNWDTDRDELPPQPKDMAYHEYIDFLLGRYCHRCMKGTNLQICWEVRARYCPPCRQIINRNENPQRVGYHYRDEKLRSWVGSLKLPASIAETNIYSLMPVLSDNWYLQENLVLRGHYNVRVQDLDEFVEKLRSTKPKDRPKFIEERQAYIKLRRRDQPRAFRLWHEKQLEHRAESVKDRKQQRFNTILEKLQKIDWDDEVELMDDDTLAAFKALPSVNQAKPMTDRMWKNAEPTIVEFLERAQAARLARERRDTLAQRFNALRNALRRLDLSWRPGRPTTWEYATALPAIRELIEQPNNVAVGFADFKALKDDGTLDAFVETQNEAVRAFFAGKVRTSLDGAVTIPEDVDPLSLAVGAVFKCNAWCERAGTWSHLRKHWCDGRTRCRRYNPRDVYATVAAGVLSVYGWFEDDWYVCAPALRRAVELAGLDPATATPADMDASPVRFACTVCDKRLEEYNYRGHVEAFGWMSIIGHTQHLDQVYALSPAASECVRSIEGIAIARAEKEYNELCDFAWYCGVCKGSGEGRLTHERMLKHLASPSWHKDVTIIDPQEGRDYYQNVHSDGEVVKRTWSVYVARAERGPGRNYYTVENALREGRAAYFNFDKDEPAAGPVMDTVET